MYFILARGSEKKMLVTENFEQKQKEENSVINLNIPITRFQQLSVLSFCFHHHFLLHQVFLLLVLEYFKANHRYYIILLVSTSV